MGRASLSEGAEVDADCGGGTWCDESAHTCAATLANGTPLPVDAPHTNPSLSGVCTAPAAALVCVSGVCDTSDNLCGLANGDGPCTPVNGGARSAAAWRLQRERHL